MDINWTRGYKAPTRIETDFESTSQSDKAKMDKDFLNQIDRVDELFSLPEKLEDEIIICECFCVNVADIREACKTEGVFDLKKMQDGYSMGLGCMSCLKQIDSWVNKIF